MFRKFIFKSISQKTRRGLMWLTSDKVTPEGCGRRSISVTYQTTVLEGLNVQKIVVQPPSGLGFGCRFR